MEVRPQDDASPADRTYSRSVARYLRWSVPVAVVAVIGSGAALSAANAGDPPSVANRTPQQVLALAAGSTVDTISGTVETRTDLGLPDLSGLATLGGPGGRGAQDGSSRATDLQGLVTRFLTGENTLRVWADGPDRIRAQLLDPLQELNLVRNGSTLWTYSSRDNTVGKGTLPTSSGGTSGAAPSDPTQQIPTPDALARDALAKLDPTTTVSLDDPTTVASRPTYSLVLTPRSAGTLVERIVLNIDAQNGVPLRAGVYAKGQSQAAILSAFTAVSFAEPSADIFAFSPPPGATVQDLSALPRTAPSAQDRDAVAAQAAPVVHGTGWATIVEARNPASMGLLDSGPASGGAALQQLTTAVDGGRALTSSLFTVLLTDDGRVLAGSVPLASLQDAAKK